MAGLDRLQQKIKHWLRGVVSCCRDQDEEEWKPVIGLPYDFRREDVCIAGLSSSEQEDLRRRAVTDAKRMAETWQPIGSAMSTAKPTSAAIPSSTSSTSTPTTTTTTTTAAAAAAPRLDRVILHTRNLSNSLKTATTSVTSPSGNSSLLTTDADSPVLSESSAVSSSAMLFCTAKQEGARIVKIEGNEKGDAGHFGGGSKSGSTNTTWAGCEEVDDGDSAKGMTGGSGGVAYVRAG